jgi:hypothetical protein
MVKVTDFYSPQSFEIEELLHAGMEKAARSKAAQYLRDGVSSRVFLTLVADKFVDPPKKGRGQPKRSPRYWLPIAQEVESLHSDGVKLADARKAVAKKYNYSVEHVRNAIRAYEEAGREHDEICQEEWERDRVERESQDQPQK